MPESVTTVPVEWAQRKTTIYVHLRVSDLTSPTVNIEKNTLVLKGIGADKSPYDVNLELFGDVNVENSKYYVRGRGIEVILEKLDKDGPYWKRLLKDDKKNHWLKVDFDKWQDEDDSDNEGLDMGMGGMGMPGMGGNFEEMMRQMGGLGGGGGLDDLDDGDDEEIDSDDEKLPDLEDTESSKKDGN